MKTKAKKASILESVASLGGDIINRDSEVSKEEFKEIVLERLNTLIFVKKPITKEELTTDLLEILADKFYDKYNIKIYYIAKQSPINAPLKYSLMLRDDSNSSYIKTLYSRTLFEGLSKAVLYMYYYTK